MNKKMFNKESIVYLLPICMTNELETGVVEQGVFFGAQEEGSERNVRAIDLGTGVGGTCCSLEG